MEPERSRELRYYLQKTLKLPFALPDPEEDPEFNDVLHDKLKQYHEKLRDALKIAFPKEESLRLLVEQELGGDLGEIDDGKSYVDKLLNTIEWMESKGCLLEFIAAAHRRQDRSTKLNVFVRKTLDSILKSLIPTQQTPQPEETPQPELVSLVPASLEASNGRGNNHGSPMSKGVTAGNTAVAPAPASVLSESEPDQEHAQDQPIQFPHKIASTDQQPREKLIALAHTRIREARNKIQVVYDMFQNGEKISDADVVNSIKRARDVIGGISDIFAKTPIPNDHALHF